MIDQKSSKVEWNCKVCPINNNQDCGPWQENAKLFKQIEKIHKHHHGWQIGKPDLTPKESLEKEANQVMGNLINDFFDELDKKKQTKKFAENNDILKEIVNIISKTVKNDLSLIYNILFNGLSAFTPNPYHLMIMERTSEGKTYPALQIANYFPKENVMILGSATPQSFKYAQGILVDEDYNPIEEKLQEIENEIQDLKQKQRKMEVKQLEKIRRNLLSKSKTLVDLRNKWIIFKEPPSTKLLEMLYSTLSSDEEFNEHKITPDSGRGKRQTYTVVLRGTPAMLISTARDETTSKRWQETFSRFNIVSPVSKPEKYRAGMDLIAKANGLPKEIYEEFVIGEKDKKLAKNYIKHLIQSFQKLNGECLNPFLDELSKKFPQEIGYRWRQFQRFNNLFVMHAFCYSEQRPKLLLNGKKIPVVTGKDLQWTIDIFQEGEIIPPNKLNWLNEVFKKAFAKKGQEVNFENDITRFVIRGKDLVDYCKDNNLGKFTTKQIRENYLENLFDHGYIEKDKDPNNRARDCYWIDDNPNNGKSPLIAVSSFNKSCVNLFLEKYLKRRFSFEYKNEKISLEDFVKIVIDGLDFVPKKDNNDMTMNDDSIKQLPKIPNHNERRQTTINNDCGFFDDGVL